MHREAAPVNSKPIFDAEMGGPSGKLQKVVDIRSDIDPDPHFSPLYGDHQWDRDYQRLVGGRHGFPGGYQAELDDVGGVSYHRGGIWTNHLGKRTPIAHVIKPVLAANPDRMVASDPAQEVQYLGVSSIPGDEGQVYRTLQEAVGRPQSLGNRWEHPGRGYEPRPLSEGFMAQQRRTAGFFDGEPELSSDEPHPNDTYGFKANGWQFTGKDQPTDWDDEEPPYWSYKKTHTEPGRKGLESHAEWMYMGDNEGKPVNQWVMTTFHPNRPDRHVSSPIEQRPGNVAEMADEHAHHQANDLGYFRLKDAPTPSGTEESYVHDWPGTSPENAINRRYLGPNQRGSLQGLLNILRHGPSSSSALSGEETDADLFDPKYPLGWGGPEWLKPEDPMHRLNATSEGIPAIDKVWLNTLGWGREPGLGGTSYSRTGGNGELHLMTYRPDSQIWQGEVVTPSGSSIYGWKHSRDYPSVLEAHHGMDQDFKNYLATRKNFTPSDPEPEVIPGVSQSDLPEGTRIYGDVPVGMGQFEAEPYGKGFMKLNAVDESGLKAAGIAVIALDTGRVLMQQRALNPLHCPCGLGVTWDEMNGYQHDDGSVSHDGEYHGQSVSDLLDQGHTDSEDDTGADQALSNYNDLEGSDTSGFDKTAALEFDPNEGTWEFPGGKIDSGESPRDAAIREFREEVGQDLPPGVFVGAWVSPGGLTVTAAEEPSWLDNIDYSGDAAAGLNPEDDWVHGSFGGRSFLYRRGRDDGESHFIMEPNQHTNKWVYFNTKGHGRKGFNQAEHAMDYGNFLVDDDDYDIGHGRVLPPHESNAADPIVDGADPRAMMPDDQYGIDGVCPVPGRGGDQTYANGQPPVPGQQMPRVASGPVYKGFIYLIQREKDIDLGNREIANPDDPDGDMTEQSAWWEIEHAKDNPALREECKEGTPWDELEMWADKSVRENKQVKEALTRLAAGYPTGYPEGYVDPRPDLPGGLRYHDAPDQPYQSVGNEDFWRFQDPTLVPPLNRTMTPGYQIGQGLAHPRSVDAQPMILTKPQSDYVNEEHFDEAPVSSPRFGPKTEVKWNEPICENCYLKYGDLIPAYRHNTAMNKYYDDLGEDKHEFNPMNPEFVRGKLREARVAMPLTQDEPVVRRIIPSGEGSLNRDVTMPSGNWIGKTLEDRQLRGATTPEARENYLRSADKMANMEEFASRLGRALSDREDEPLTPEVVRSAKKSDLTPTVYVRRYDNFRDLLPPEGAQYVDTPRGQQIGYLHSVLGDSDKENFANTGIVGDKIVSHDHTLGTLPKYADALASGDSHQENLMRWNHDFVALSPFEKHFLSEPDAISVAPKENPLGPGDTERAIAAAETLRPWARERGIEHWVDAAQQRMGWLGEYATGENSMFPHQMPHEAPVAHVAAEDKGEPWWKVKEPEPEPDWVKEHDPEAVIKDKNPEDALPWWATA